MLLSLFALWLAFNGRLSTDVVVVGALVCAALYFFCCRFLDFSIRKDFIILRELPYILAYACNLIVEVVKSSISTLKLIFAKKQPHSAIIKFHSGLKSSAARVLLANSITLTPGTITLELSGDEYTVHCLDIALGDGIEESSFVRRLLKMEEVAGL